ncbi:MAG TPA: hypothetical protein VF278_07540 [Pirellulales bacterium]
MLFRRPQQDISALASDDDRTELGRARSAAFDAGRAVGRILAACEDWQRQLFYLLYISGQQDIERFEEARAGWRAAIRARLPHLRKCALLDPDGNAATWLQSLDGNLWQACIPALAPENWPSDAWYGEWQDDVADEIRKVSVIRDAVWLAFGEILHCLAREVQQRQTGTQSKHSATRTADARRGA